MIEICGHTGTFANTLNHDCHIKRTHMHILDNDINLGFMTRKDQVSSKECKTHGSFIKWYPDDFCLSNTLQHPFWTSGRRYEQTFYLKRNRKISRLFSYMY